MTNRHLIYLFFIFMIFVNTSYSCQHHAANEGLNVSSTNKSVETPEINIKENSLVEKPAVIYKSTDIGNTWSSFAKGIPEDATLSGIKQGGNKIYVTTDYHGIYITTDGQNNWKPLNSTQLKNLDINCIEVESNKLVIGTLNNGILISNDGGLNWNQAERSFINSPIRAFIKSKEKLFAGTDSGIFESVDMGNTWTHVFGEIQILGFTSLNEKIYAATQNGVLMSNGDYSNWTSIFEGDALHDISNDGQYIYAMTIGQELLKTQNNGESWENAQSGITRPPNYYTNELQHIDNNIFSAQWIGIYHSSNNGNSWKILNNLPDSTAFSTLEITDFGIISGISIR